MYNLNCWSVMGLQANPDPPFEGRGFRLANPQRPAPIPENRSGRWGCPPDGHARLPFSPTGQGGCRYRPRWLSLPAKVVVAEQDPTDHPPVIDPRHASRLIGQKRLQTRKLRFCEPEVMIRHGKSPIVGEVESHLIVYGNPLYGS